eukprot:504566-Rhodomonas_salina.2
MTCLLAAQVLMIITSSVPLAKNPQHRYEEGERRGPADPGLKWYPHCKAWTGLLLWIQMAQVRERDGVNRMVG